MAAQLRTAYGRLGFTQQVAATIVDDQGINSMEELAYLDDTSVEQLCKVIRRPGGTVNAPDGTVVPNPGMPISLRAENNLKLAAYMARHRLHRISRSIVAADITLENVRKMIPLQDHELFHENPEPDMKIDDKDWPTTFANLDEILINTLGEEEIPLFYVVRQNQVVTPEAGDPETNYRSASAEMIGRAPHGENGNNPMFQANNGKVMDIISKIFRDTISWTYVKGFVKDRDGRGAYWSAKGHYLGPNSINDQAGTAEKQLDQLSYNGESKRWNFEKYATAHKKLHLILSGLAQYGYSPPDERSYVCKFLNGIKTKDLDSTKNTILANSEYQDDFDKCVQLFKSYITQNMSSSNPPTRTIAELKVLSKDVEVEDRYYPPAEYLKLTPEQREALRLKREKRGHKPGSNPVRPLARLILLILVQIRNKRL